VVLEVPPPGFDDAPARLLDPPVLTASLPPPPAEGKTDPVHPRATSDTRLAQLRALIRFS
jgi:hypothetical protein